MRIFNRTNFNTFFIGLLLALVSISCSNNNSNEYVGEDQFMRVGSRTGNSNSNAIINQPTELWKVKTGGSIVSSPVLADGNLYIGSGDHKLYAIDQYTGNELWSFETEGAINSTPAISDGKVFFLSYDGYFYAVHQKDGSLLWKFKTEGESKFEVKDYYKGDFKPDFWDFYLSSPVVQDKTVYFGSSDHHVYALNIENGKELWNFKTGGSIHSSPAISENLLMIGSWDSRVYCLNALTGEKKWVYETERDTASYIWLGIQATPAIDKGIAYLGSRDAKYYAFDIHSGDTLWAKDTFDRSWMPSSAAIDNENIYTGSSDSFSFFSLDKQTGAINYKTKTNAYTFSSPVIDSQMGYIGAANGRVFGIELKSGDIKWQFKTNGVKNDTLKLFNESGEIDVKRYGELTTGIEDMPSLSYLLEQVFKNTGAVMSSPAIANQVLYFGSSDGYIYAITDKKINN